MEHYPSSILNLIKNLARLPGIGEKTAERLAMHMLGAPVHEAKSLAAAIIRLKEKTRLCAKCFSLSDDELCRICRDPARDSSVICVVEQPADMAAIEKAKGFNGIFHILQGVLSPMDNIGPEDLRIAELLERIKKDEPKEIIIATSTNVEGEATASFLANLISKHPVQVTRIASGVPLGGDLKYVNQMTLKRAMEARRGF